MSIRTVSTREVYRNPWLRLREDQIERTGGKPGIYGVVEKDDCAVILPVEDDAIYLVEQFRYTIQQRALELPQGGWETANVDPEELARGELREETGLVAEQCGSPTVSRARSSTSSSRPVSAWNPPIPIRKSRTSSCGEPPSRNSSRCCSTAASRTAARSPHGASTASGRITKNRIPKNN